MTMTNEEKTVPELLRELAAAEHGIELAEMFSGLAERVESEYMQEQVYTIVNARYKAKRPMVISTNLTAEELKHPKNVMAARIYGRIPERCLPVKFDGPDRRKQNTCYGEMLGILEGE